MGRDIHMMKRTHHQMRRSCDSDEKGELEQEDERHPPQVRRFRYPPPCQRSRLKHSFPYSLRCLQP